MQANPKRVRSLWKCAPLRHSADGRPLLFLAALAILFAAQWLGWARHWALSAMSGVLAFVACVIKHNHIHCRTFNRRSWNRAFDYALSLATAQPITAIISIHNERHHGRNHTEHDCVRSSLVNFRSNILNLFLFPMAAVRAVHAIKARDIARWKIEKPLLHKNLIHERIAVVAFVAGLLVLDWRATLLYLGLPWMFGHWCIVAINLIQHQECDHASGYNHSRNLTGSIVNWLFLNNGYHTAHHLRPALHWSRLPQFHREHVAPRMRADLNESSLAACLWRFVTHPRS